MSCLMKSAGSRFAVAMGCLLILVSSEVPEANAKNNMVMATDYRSPGRKQLRRQRKHKSDCCCEACLPPWWAHRGSVFGEILYLHATDADLAHAQQQNGIGGAGTAPFGRIGTLDPDYEPAARIGITKACTNCSSVTASFTHYESRAVDFLDQPGVLVIPGTGGEVGSLVHHPGAVITASVGPVNSNYDIDFQVGEIEYRSVWKASSRYVINWSRGVRYGHLEQDFTQSGIFAGGAAGVLNTTTNVDFDGGGLKAGLDGEHRIGCRGFSIFGKVSVSPMSGTVQADYTMITDNSILLANAVWKDDRIITLLDYEAGLSWTDPCRKWRFSSGYTGAHWFNAVTTAEFINTVQANDYDSAKGTISFSGLTARVERRW